MWTGPRSAGAGWSPGLARCPGRAGALPKVPGARGPQAGMLCPLPAAWASKDGGLWGVGFRAPRPLSSCHRPHAAPEQPMQHTAGLLPSCSSPSSGAWLTLGPPESPDRIRRAGPPAGSSRWAEAPVLSVALGAQLGVTCWSPRTLRPRGRATPRMGPAGPPSSPPAPIRLSICPSILPSSRPSTHCSTQSPVPGRSLTELWQ